MHVWISSTPWLGALSTALWSTSAPMRTCGPGGRRRACSHQTRRRRSPGWRQPTPRRHGVRRRERSPCARRSMGCSPSRSPASPRTSAPCRRSTGSFQGRSRDCAWRPRRAALTSGPGSGAGTTAAEGRWSGPCSPWRARRRSSRRPRIWVG